MAAARSPQEKNQRGAWDMSSDFFVIRVGGSTQANQNEDSANEGGNMY